MQFFLRLEGEYLDRFCEQLEGHLILEDHDNFEVLFQSLADYVAQRYICGEAADNAFDNTPTQRHCADMFTQALSNRTAKIVAFEYQMQNIPMMVFHTAYERYYQLVHPILSEIMQQAAQYGHELHSIAADVHWESQAQDLIFVVHTQARVNDAQQLHLSGYVPEVTM